MMKKSLLLLTIATMLLPMSMMAQTLVLDKESGLEYLDDGDGSLYIDVGGSAVTTINGTPSNQYFVSDGGLRSNWRNNISDTRLRGQAKWYKEDLDKITTLNIANNGPTTFKGIEYFRNLESLTIPMISNNSTALSLDLSKNTKLSSLIWDVGTFTKKLTYINVSNTQLTTLPLPNGANANLKEIVAENSKLTTLDISSLSVLETVNLANSADLTTLTVKTSGTNTTLSSLNLQNCTKLAETYTSSSPLDLTAYTNLSRFSVLVSGSGLVIGESVLVDENLSVTSLNIDITSLADEHIDLTGYTNLQTLTITGTNDGATTVDASGLMELTTVVAKGSGITELNLSGCENLAPGPSNATSGDQLNVRNCGKLKILNISGCVSLRSADDGSNNFGNDLSLGGCSSLEVLYVDGCEHLKKITATDCKLNTISIENCSALTGILAARNRITNIDFLKGVLENPGFYQVQLNGGAPNRGAAITEPTNTIKYVDSSKLPKSLTKLLLRCGLIESLDLVDHDKIVELEVDRNRLWALNLGNLKNVVNFKIAGQRTYAQVKVHKEDGKDDELRLYLPKESAELHTDRMSDFVFGLDGYSPEKPKIGSDSDGAYLSFSPPTTTNDIELKDAEITYLYETHAEGPAVTDSKMDVTIELDPYILYLNPKTNTPKNKKESEDIKVGYYSGTLCLDYDAVVPKGVKVYIATSVKNEGEKSTSTGDEHHFDLLVLKPIGGENAIIPAGTAMYVKSESAAGLYDFKKAGEPNYIGWTGARDDDAKIFEDLVKSETEPRVYTPDEWSKIEATQKKIKEILEPSKLGKNLLTGTLAKTSLSDISDGKVLTLGRENSTGLIGFWPFKGSSIAAHRCYITAADYNNALDDTAVGEAKGVSFFFDEEDGEDDVIVTEIQTVEQKAVKSVREGWYTLQGVRLGARPTKQGVYIHNGRTEIVK